MQCQKLKTYMETGRVVFLPARIIQPNPAQPRKVFRQEALTELCDSIRQHGILQPLSVRRSGTGYELIAGERRLRAAQLAGLTDIRFPTWLVICTLGRLPSLVSSAVCGAALGTKNYVLAAIVFSATFGVSIVGLLIYNHISKKRRENI